MKKYNMKIFELDNISDFVPLKDGERRFDCIGGNKNFQVFLAPEYMSRSEFMIQYKHILDPCLNPIFEDDDIVITQDARYALPGFYIIATKTIQRTIAQLKFDVYKKCVFYQQTIANILEDKYDFKSHLYYEEHYKKPASTHLWVLPLHEEVIKNNKLKISIESLDVWKYLDVIPFSESRDKILEINNYMREKLKEIKYEL